MATARYEHCQVCDVRYEVQRRLQLPGPKGPDDPPAKEFWARAEQQGRLAEALALYDKIAAGWAAWSRVPRETKSQFLERVEREGRRVEAERVLAELLTSGLSQREAQEQLVERFQPLDGTQARAWQTPDPWEGGRLFRRKADQDKLVAQADGEDADEVEQNEVENRVWWARLRQEERQALAEARRRARDLKAASPAAASAPTTQERSVPEGVGAGVA
jgi:hypothetical protein